jgi:hypothetical protein
VADVVEHANVRMIQTGDRSGFALEALPQLRIVGKLRGENLDGYRSVESGVRRAINCAHPTGAE